MEQHEAPMAIGQGSIGHNTQNGRLDDADSVCTSPTTPSSHDGNGEEAEISERAGPLSKAIEAAGLFASTFGIASIECWVFLPREARLERPDGGVWVDSALVSSIFGDETGGESTNPSLEALLIDSKPPKVPPGIGLPGALWSESRAVTIPSSSAVREWANMDDAELTENLRSAAAGDILPDGWNTPPARKEETDGGGWGRGMLKDVRRTVKHSFRNNNPPAPKEGIDGGGLGRGMLKDAGDTIKNSFHNIISSDRGIDWRELGPMMRDPDRFDDARLALHVGAGFKLASGIRFEVGSHKGVLIFLAAPLANARTLRSTECEAYLRHAAGVISAAYVQSLSLER